MSWWSRVSDSPELRQGDLIKSCGVLVIPDTFDPSTGHGEFESEEADCIVVTQSCDLVSDPEQKIQPVSFVTLCRVYSIVEMEQANPKLKGREWNAVRNGRNEGLLLLAPFPDAGSNDPRQCHVVDFSQIVTLPYKYLSRHAGQATVRWRLIPPYVEHLSQSFGKHFMRIGLPERIPDFPKESKPSAAG